MFAVIPVADEPHNPSLSYALKSILEHTDLIPLTIGKDFGLCEHIPIGQSPGRRDVFRNTDHAMEVACRTLQEPFVWSADDIYWIRPAQPIRWALGFLKESTGNTIYTKRKHRTAQRLHELGLPTYDYEAHVPMLVHPDPMLEALHHAKDGLDKRSIYSNLTGLPDLIAPDVKVRSRRDPLPTASWASTEGNPLLWPALAEVLP